MATYSFVCASPSYMDGSATSAANDNFLATSGSTLRLMTQRTPASASADGLIGEICVDSSYIYVCVASNTWVRCSISTW